MDRIRQLTQAFVRLRARVNALEAQEMPIMQSTDDVSSPPTDAELDTAFGTPSEVGDGFVGLVDDAGGGSTGWLCVTINGAWWYEELTKAT